MRFGLHYNTAVAGTDPANLKAIARHVDELGFESFYVPEHVALYPGARIYESELAPDLSIADPLECLAFVAAWTTTVLLGTGVLLLPFHHPVGLAKRLATIDVRSGGRMRLLPIHVAGSGAAAARRAGRRGDGFFPGGRLTAAQRVAQIELMRTTARAEGRDPEVLQYTRWGSIDMQPSGVEAYAAQGVDRLVVGTTSADLNEQLRQLEAFATLHGLRR
jgi:alkanesulfonate monooxygenase SsuD/methylene tetrahydromethanopterin reductase-like flavin-dependent oxidoreductase (luciferase family)